MCSPVVNDVACLDVPQSWAPPTRTDAIIIKLVLVWHGLLGRGISDARVCVRVNVIVLLKRQTRFRSLLAWMLFG